MAKAQDAGGVGSFNLADKWASQYTLTRIIEPGKPCINKEGRYGGT